ncbi:MAG: MazG family protein [Oscillospiraceae bacterium]|nr:MazG family protein [Oscillospiraceae bacterium]
MVDFVFKERYNIEDLRKIVHLLRSPGGCPWDIEQTHASIRRELLEEAFEVAEAIDEDSAEHLREELGDVLLQVVFHSDIEADRGRFDLDGVADGIVKKLIFRHPHVFSDEEMPSWEDIKRRERGQRAASEAMRTVAKSLPQTWRYEKIAKKAQAAGLDADSEADVRARIAALSQEEASEENIGALLGECCRLAQRAGVDPEAALSKASDKLIEKCAALEKDYNK